MTTLVHNNLRMMWHQAFSQDMADQFVSAHLMVSAGRTQRCNEQPYPVAGALLLCAAVAARVLIVTTAFAESKRVRHWELKRRKNSAVPDIDIRP